MWESSTSSFYHFIVCEDGKIRPVNLVFHDTIQQQQCKYSVNDLLGQVGHRDNVWRVKLWRITGSQDYTYDMRVRWCSINNTVTCLRYVCMYVLYYDTVFGEGSSHTMTITKNNWEPLYILDNNPTTHILYRQSMVKPPLTENVKNWLLWKVF